MTKRGGLSQHRLQSLFELDGERVGLTTRPLGRNGQGFANVHAAMHRTVDPARVCGIFLEPFQRFQNTLGGRLAINISTRIRFSAWANVQSSKCRQRVACSRAVQFPSINAGRMATRSFLIRATVVAAR